MARNVKKPHQSRKAVAVGEIHNHDCYARVVVHAISPAGGRVRPYQVLTIWHDGYIATTFANDLHMALASARAVLDTAHDEGATIEDISWL